MNKELKLILFTLKMKIKFGNNIGDKFCRTIADTKKGGLIKCTNIYCLNCLFYQDYQYADRIIHVWHQL